MNQPITEHTGDQSINQILGNDPGQTNNGMPDGTPTPDQVKANRVAVMKDQMQQTNTPHDPQTGLPLPSVEQDPNQLPTADAPPEVPLQNQTQPTVTPPQQQPPTQQPLPQQPTPPADPQTQQPAPTEPQQQTADPVQQQFEPQEGEQLTPEEQQIQQRLDALMAEPQVDPNQQQANPMEQAILQNQQMLLQMLNNQQNQAYAPQQFTQPALPSAPGADPFGYDPVQQQFQPPQQGAFDPNQALIANSIAQLSGQIQEMQQQNQQIQQNQQREQGIQGLMQSNGVSRQHAERAFDYYQGGNYQAGHEVLSLASAPVIAKQQQMAERAAVRDAAGQSLTPGPQGAVRTTPDQQQAIITRWNAIKAMGEGTNQRLAYLQFVKDYPEQAAMLTGSLPGQQVV